MALVFLRAATANLPLGLIGLGGPLGEVVDLLQTSQPRLQGSTEITPALLSSCGAALVDKLELEALV